MDVRIHFHAIANVIVRSDSVKYPQQMVNLAEPINTKSKITLARAEEAQYNFLSIYNNEHLKRTVQVYSSILDSSTSSASSIIDCSVSSKYFPNFICSSFRSVVQPSMIVVNLTCDC